MCCGVLRGATGALWARLMVSLWFGLSIVVASAHAATGATTEAKAQAAPTQAITTLDPDLAQELTASQTTKRLAAIQALGQSGSAAAGKVLLALTEANVYVTADGQVFLKTDPPVNVLTGQVVTEIPEAAKRVRLITVSGAHCKARLLTRSFLMINQSPSYRLPVSCSQARIQAACLFCSGR